MGVREQFLAGTARQLGRPEGWRGRILARGLNRGNRKLVAAAVAAAALEPGQTAADIGFGGGVGLRLLLDQVRPSGHVHGVDLSHTMVAAAGRTYAQECSDGVLSLHQGSMPGLPLPDRCLDGAITVNTVYFVDDLAAAVADLARTLRPEGRLVVGVGDPEVMARMPVTEYGFRLRQPDEVLEAMRAAGMVATRAERFEDGKRVGFLLVGSLPRTDR